MGNCGGRPRDQLEPDDVTLHAASKPPTNTADIQLEIDAAAAQGSSGKIVDDVVPELKTHYGSTDAGLLRGSCGGNASTDALGEKPRHRGDRGGSFVSDVARHTLPLTKSLSVVHAEGSISKMHAVYDVSNGTVIGRGGNGSVSIITKLGTDQKFALKTVKTEELTPKLRAELRNEIDTQKSLDHPNIVRVYESFEDVASGEVFIIMELCTGGDLVSRLRQRNNRHGMGETGAATLMEEMLSAVLYCHSHGVVHRDIKLDNFM